MKRRRLPLPSPRQFQPFPTLSAASLDPADLRLSARIRACAALVLTAAVLLPATGRSAAIVLEGDPSPVVPGANAYTGFGAPVVNNNGQVAFYAAIDASAENSNLLVMQNAARTALQVKYRSASPAPNTEANTVFAGIPQRFSIDDSGRMAFTADVEGPGTTTNNDFGVWSENSPTGVLTLVARQGSNATGISPASQYNLETSSLNLHQTGSGVVLLGDTSTNSAIWRTTNASTVALGVVAREGLQSPGITNGSYGTFNRVAVNTTARLAFAIDVSGVAGSGIDDNNNSGVFSDGAGGGVLLVAREGIGTPVGTAAGVLYDRFDPPSINSLGKVAFVADLKGTGVIGQDEGIVNNQGIWRTSSSSTALVLVARAGSDAPGTATGVLFDRGFEQVRIGKDERISFSAELAVGQGGVTVDNDTGVWSSVAGALTGTLALVAREGSQAPGLASGVLFGDFRAPEGVSITANNNSQVAFTLSLQGTGITPLNDSSLWAQRPDGVLALIAREGDMFQVKPSDSRQISVIEFNAGDPTNQLNDGWNDASEIAFLLSFEDGSSGIFKVLVPEPGAASLLVMGIALVATRRRRR